MGSWAVALYEYVIAFPFPTPPLSFSLAPSEVTEPTETLFCSYDAGEDNEISFKEGERIAHIEAVSEDWWQGTNGRGDVGLFPGALRRPFFHSFVGTDADFGCVANYVELQG